MRAFGNVVWHFPFFGFLSALSLAIIGGLLVLTVVFAPLGLGVLQIAKFYLAPFSYGIVSEKDLGRPESSAASHQAWKAWSGIAGILWIVFFGWWMFLLAVIQAGLTFLTIIFIPLGIIVVKTLPAIFNPVGKVCVSRAVAEEIQTRKDRQEVATVLGAEASPEALAKQKESQLIPEDSDKPSQD